MLEVCVSLVSCDTEINYRGAKRKNSQLSLTDKSMKLARKFYTDLKRSNLPALVNGYLGHQAEVEVDPEVMKNDDDVAARACD